MSLNYPIKLMFHQLRKQLRCTLLIVIWVSLLILLNKSELIKLIVLPLSIRHSVCNPAISTVILLLLYKSLTCSISLSCLSLSCKVLNVLWKLSSNLVVLHVLWLVATWRLENYFFFVLTFQPLFSSIEVFLIHFTSTPSNVKLCRFCTITIVVVVRLRLCDYQMIVLDGNYTGWCSYAVDCTQFFYNHWLFFFVP